jgi:hypothetical protein
MSAAVAKVLREGKARILDEKDWCAGQEEGKCCAITAIDFYGPGTDITLCGYAERALNLAARQLHTSETFPEDLVEAAYINDKYGHAAALRLYDHAIENEEGLS